MFSREIFSKVLGIYFSQPTSAKLTSQSVRLFPGVCVQVIDFGTHKNEYEGEVSTLHQIRLGWELVGDDKLSSGASHLMQDGKPFLVTEIYTLGLGEQANLRAILKGWRGKSFTEQELKGFDISALLGKACLLDITHKAEKERAEESQGDVGYPHPHQHNRCARETR